MTRALLAEGLDPMEILEEGVVTGLNDVGNRFAANEAIVLDLVRAGVTAKACIPLIEAVLPRGETKKNDKKIVLGTMLSQHNSGKNLVGTLLSIGGFEVVDVREKYRVIVGGAVTSEKWASGERADGCAPMRRTGPTWRGACWESTSGSLALKASGLNVCIADSDEQTLGGDR